MYSPENTWGEIPLTTLSPLFGVVSAALGSRDAESKSDQTSAGSHSMDLSLSLSIAISKHSMDTLR